MKCDNHPRARRTPPARTLLRLLSLVAFSALAGCDRAGEGSVGGEDLAVVELQGSAAAAPPKSVAGEASRGATDAARERPPVAAPAVEAQLAMLIRTGYASVEVDSLDPAIAAVRTLAARLGGYIANSIIHSGDEQIRSAQLELRLPADRFDEAIGGLDPVGDVETIEVQAQDVGEEFVDLSARLENARRLEARLIDILATRTGRLEDVLAVERELARVREEIERMEGRLRYLQSRVATSTLNVNVHEPAPLVALHPGDDVIVRAFRTAWTNFVHLLAGLIASLGFVVPLGGLAVLVWALGRRLVPRVREG